MEGFEERQERKLPLGPDLVEECQAVDAIVEGEYEPFAPLFDPVQFNEAHGPLELEDYRLPQADLRDWAERCVSIRAAIKERASVYA